MIKDHIAASLALGMDDLELAPFYEHGRQVKAYRLFRLELGKIMEEMNEALAE